MTYRNEPSQHTRGTISTPGPLTFSYSTTLLHQHNGQVNHLGLQRLIINSHILQKNSQIFTSTFGSDRNSPALLCFSLYESVLAFPSSVTASILSSSFSSLSHFHFLLFFSNVIFLFSTILCLPSSKLLPSFTASNFTWLGGKEESNKFTVTNSLALRESTATLLPCPVAYTLPAGCRINSLEI